MHYRKIFALLLVCFTAASQCARSSAQDTGKSPLKLGIIGLDTSHVQAFTKQINRPDPKKPPLNLKVVAAFPGGSEDLPSSRDRVAGFTKQLQEMDVEIVDSIDALLLKVDAVLLESVDGRKHLEQAVSVFRSGKRVFIDKPLAANLTDAIAIDLVAKHFKATWFSSSSLRFSDSIRKFRDDQAYNGKIHGAISWGPCSIDATHVDLYWYGIHGVESLYTAMGTGCQAVSQTSTNGADTVVGVWNDGRTGVFRGIRSGSSGFGMVVFSDKKIETDSKFDGYEPLVYEIDKFLNGGPIPVSNDETLEIMAFMQAAFESKSQGGQSVKMSEIWQRHRDAAEKIAAKIVNP